MRIFVLHHVTRSSNSVCHTIGERLFADRDRSADFWPLAILDFGRYAILDFDRYSILDFRRYSHNLHHADPTAAHRDQEQRSVARATKSRS